MFTPRPWTTGFLIVLMCLAFLPPSAYAAKRDFADGEVLVRFKSGNESKGAKAIKKMGAKIIEKINAIDISRLDLPKGLVVEKALEKLRALPFVEFAEPNYIFEPSWEPSDPKWNDQWGIQKIQTASGWGLETGDRSVIIAILDTGVDLDHPDLKDKIVAGYDYLDMDDKPDDVGGHGTHCAGIAAAFANNGIGIAGVCSNCSIMPLRVLGPESGLASDVAKGIIWAVDHGAKVISMSLGGTFSSTTQNDAIDYAWQKGAIPIAAAGNYNTTTAHYPGYYPTCLAVASSESDDSRSQFSNYGDWVDVAAPGGMIISTLPGGGYGYKSGTSMATPFVAGLAGLIFSEIGKNTSPQTVRNIIEGSTDSAGSWTAHGRINVLKALRSAKSSSSTGTGQNQEPPPTKQPDSSSSSAAKTTTSGDPPASFEITKGSAIKSPTNALLGSDDALLVLSSTKTGKRRYLDLDVSSKVTCEGRVDFLQVLFEGRYYVAEGQITAYLWNWTTSKWDWVTKESIPTHDETIMLRKYGASPYVSSKKEVKLRIYAESNWFSTFETGIDKIRFYATCK